MNILMVITCSKCCKSVTTFARFNESKYHRVSRIIEQEPNGFECIVGHEDKVKVKCSCGNEIRLSL